MEYVQHSLMRLLWVVVVVMLAVENGCNGCLEKERIALLQLKHSLNIPNRIDRLPSWEEDDSMDCCRWEGVECNSTTRRVIKLELGYTRDWRSENDYWHLNASILLPFESLRSLNLSRNLLRSFIGNEGIGMFPNFSNLEELDLSYNYYLDNSILPSLNKLSNLKLLRLAENDLNDSIYVEGIGILSNLTNLEELDLSSNYLGNGILPSLNKLSNLKFLRLANINLNGSIFVKGIGILSNLTNLEELDLSQNNLGNGVVPSLNKFSNLKVLRLAQNNLNGSIYVKGIRILSNLTNLEKLDLRDNYLGNDILLSLNKLSNLKFLRLAWNYLNGSLYVKEFDGLNNLKELDLSNNAIASISALNGSQEESGILKKLEVLDLSDNEALNNSVWSFLGGLSSIKTLDLSYNRRLHGAVHNKDLRNISNIETLLMDGVVLDDVLPYIRVITSIQVLSLTYCDSKRIPSIEGLCDLKKLRELDVTRSDFGETLPWCLANLTSLRLLDLTSNHFTGNIARSPLISLTSLEYLAISDNNFEVPISFMSFFNHSKLMFIESLNNMLEEDDFPATSPSFQLIGLRLSNSKLGHITRSFPRFLYDQHDLILVKLSHFTGKFPYWLLDNNTRMETLILSYNSFDGPLLLPSRHMRNLIELDISNNHLEGFLPYKIAGPFPSLEFFNMSTNNFEGNIPSSFGDMTSLKVLDLSNNRLSGKIPVQLAEGCVSLRFLSLSTNNLTGAILPHQNNLTTLAVLYSNNNGFTEIPSSLSRSTMLTVLDVSANQLVGKIPVGFIGNNTFLSFLVMAGNHLEGPIPIEFCQLKNLQWLDLSENNITGGVPSCFSSTYMSNIRLSKNRLDGPFPMTFQYSYLMELDLSYNQFSGTIPTWIDSLSELTVLLLQNNNFEGNIPKELCNVSSLAMIDLSFNNLSGSIPPCISRIEFNGMHSQPFDLGIGVTDSRHIFKLLLHDLRMVLHKRGIETDQEMSLGRSIKPDFVEFTTKGMSLFYTGIVLDLFSGINLSHNRLIGPIPPEIANLSHIKVLNLSHNNFTGTIPVTFSNLKSIESLDLSYNHLHGKIPSQLTILNFLVVFNLSFNNLSGRMPPRVNQFGTFESSSYIGNPLLCGEPLPRKCNANDSPPSPPRAAVNNTKEDSGFMDMDVFYMSFVGSYVTVVLAIMAILWINPYWRRAWFRLVEVFITSFYYFVVDNLVWRRRGFIWK